MKNVLILLFVFIGYITATAQSPSGTDCGTVTEAANLPPVYFSPFNTTAFTGSYDLEYLETFPPISFKIYFWIINKSDGTGDFTVTENDILISLEKTNRLFKPMGICFVLEGYGNINYTNIYDGAGLGTITNYAVQNNKVIANCINIYLPKSINGGNGVTNYGSDKIALRQGTLLGHYTWIPGITLAHELAHDFGLMHPWGNTNSSVATQEHVTRDVTDVINYNALTKADLIHDTPAMAGFSSEAAADGVATTDIINPSTCEYMGDLEDELGVPFAITPADVGNPMGYTYQPCGTGFTVGQGIRIREYIDLNPNVPSVLAMTSNVCINCFEDLLISLPVIASESYRVQNTITASSTLNDNIQVIYAGEEIFLEPGFETGTGSGMFLAKVSPCDPDAGRGSGARISSLSDMENGIHEKINLFYIAPNPANSVVTITGTQEIQSIVITSMDGKILYSGAPEGKTISTDVVIDSYSNGIYNVTIGTSDGKKQTKKLVKN